MNWGLKVRCCPCLSKLKTLTPSSYSVHIYHICPDWPHLSVCPHHLFLLCLFLLPHHSDRHSEALWCCAAPFWPPHSLFSVLGTYWTPTVFLVKWTPLCVCPVHQLGPVCPHKSKIRHWSSQCQIGSPEKEADGGATATVYQTVSLCVDWG